MESFLSDFSKILTQYNVDAEGLEAEATNNEEQLKKLRKKLKKNIVDPKEDDIGTSSQKLNKIIQGLAKSYEGAVKAKAYFVQTRDSKTGLFTELSKEQEHKKRLESLHAGFMKKYNEELKTAQNYETEETQSKKKYTEELQSRIKVIQDQFEVSGKTKIESIRENQHAKEQLSRLATHLQASEALVDAQLKKKGLEIDIQMSTLKQKVEMIQGLKNHGAQYGDKLEKAKLDQVKIAGRVKLFEDKEDQHKIAITKAHLLIQDYKGCIYQIRDILQKLTRESQKLSQKNRKSEQALKNSKQQEAKLNSEKDTQSAQLQGLKNLENGLKEQLKNL